MSGSTADKWVGAVVGASMVVFVVIVLVTLVPVSARFVLPNGVEITIDLLV